MQTVLSEIFKTLAAILIFAILNYALTKALWELGFKSKVKMFKEAWGAVSLFVGGVLFALGGIVLWRVF